MGTIQNHALIVNGYNDDRLHASVEKVRQYARQFGDLGETNKFDNLIVVVPAVINFTVTVFMAPDGSKEGWSTSFSGNKIREYFIEEMKQHGSVVEVQWGEDGDGVRVI